MSLDDLQHERDSPLSRDIRQAHQAGVRYIVQIDQLAKVGVDRHHHSTQGLGQFQQRSVAGVRAQCASLKNVVAAPSKRLGKAATGAAVDQEIHYPATETVASVSPAITACA